MLIARAAAASSVGRVRLVNEDSLLVSAAIFAVADGLGGHAAGDVASGIAVAELAELDAAARADVARVLTPDVLVEAIHRINGRIVAEAHDDPARLGMGTTVTGLAMATVNEQPAWIVFNVGDSRVYRFAEERLTQLTVDHSEVAELVALGEITPEQARSHPRRNIITRSLGTEAPTVPDVWVHQAVGGERFVVCSDGLTGEVTDSGIAAVLSSVPDPQSAADQLVAAAEQAGGHDNITVIVVDVDTAER